MLKRPPHFHWIQWPGWLLTIYLVVAQAIPAFDYELGVRMGTQEPAEQITEVGVAFWYGFAFADLVIYIPILIAGLIGHWNNRGWYPVILGAAMGITVYWPVTALATVVVADDAPGWELTDLTAYWVVLPLFVAWAGWCLFAIARTAISASTRPPD